MFYVNYEYAYCVHVKVCVCVWGGGPHYLWEYGEGIRMRRLVKGDLSYIHNILTFKSRIESYKLLMELKLNLKYLKNY